MAERRYVSWPESGGLHRKQYVLDVSTTQKDSLCHCSSLCCYKRTSADVDFKDKFHVITTWFCKFWPSFPIFSNNKLSVIVEIWHSLMKRHTKFRCKTEIDAPWVAQLPLSMERHRASWSRKLLCKHYCMFKMEILASTVLKPLWSSD